MNCTASLTISSLWAGAAVLVLYVLYALLAGTWSPLSLAMGADGRPSTSKFQFWLWTVVTIFSYVAVSATRFQSGLYDPISDFPRSLLLAMGLSAATMATAKGIAVSYVANGKRQAGSASHNSDDWGALIQDDDGDADLSKTQMLAWTLIGVVVYIYCLYNHMAHDAIESLKLPDIDASLMVLMGLGQGAYIGKKLTTIDTPRLTGLSPGSGPVATTIKVYGLSFGDQQNGGLITIDGQSYHPSSSLTWSDTQIQFTLPTTQLNGSAWGSGQRMQIGVIVEGQESANTLPFTVIGTPPGPPNPTPAGVPLPGPGPAPTPGNVTTG